MASLPSRGMEAQRKMRVATKLMPRLAPHECEVAPLCRSSSGSFMAITKWPHYADHTVAPLCRSRNGTITPIIDSRKLCGGGGRFR